MDKILDRTRDFLTLYLHAAGTSEVPRSFHVWSCLALLAACVSNRVGIEKFRGSLLVPNLYIFLLGPSGVGKNVAINAVTPYVRELDAVNLYRGRLTLPRLIDRLGKPFKSPATGQLILQNPRMFLVTPEIGMSIPAGPYGEDFVKGMTDLYDGSLDPLSEGTRTGGEVTVRGACITWLAGTDYKWMLRSIPQDAIEGGFLARLVTARQSYGDERHWRPQYPEDVEDVVAHLHERVAELVQLEGRFQRTPEAAAWEQAWYEQRPRPDDDALMPTWRRDHDLLLKVAMLLELSSGEPTFVLRRETLERALRAVRDARMALPAVLDYARGSGVRSADGVNAAAILVRDLVRREGKVLRSVVMQQTRLTAAQIDGVEKTLQMSGEITTEAGAGARIYVWKGKRRMPRS